MRMRRRTPPGPERRSPTKPSPRTRTQHAAECKAPRMAGVTTRSPTGKRWPTPGRASELGKMLAGRLRRDLAGRRLSAQWLRAVRGDRQGPGVDLRPFEVGGVVRNYCAGA